MLKNWLWGMSPYRPQYLPASLPVNAVLAAPLDFGVAEYEPGVLDEVGSAPPSHSGLSVRLVTALNSQTAKVGTPVEAVTTEPLFASNRHLILPVGSRVHGHVTAVDRARARHHNAELAFAFTSIEPPDLWTLDASEPRPIDATIDSIQGGHAMKHLRLSSDGATKMVESKKRFIAPAWAFIKAERSLNATADPFSTALLGAYRGKFVKEVTGGGPGLGLPASISGAMVPPLGVGFGFFGAARSIYSTFLKRGREINMPENTLIELTLDSGRE
jgi:hypothetical protein